MTHTIKSKGDDELGEILFMAFVGLYTKNPDGDFVPITDTYGVMNNDLAQDRLKQEVLL